MLKAESEFQERELIKMEREREMAILRRQHEREIYMLKRKLHENTKMQVGGSPTATTGTGSNSDPDSMSWQDGSVSVTIPTFTLSGIGSNSHVEYQVRDNLIRKGVLGHKNAGKGLPYRHHRYGVQLQKYLNGS